MPRLVSKWLVWFIMLSSCMLFLVYMDLDRILPVRSFDQQMQLVLPLNSNRGPQIRGLKSGETTESSQLSLPYKKRRQSKHHGRPPVDTFDRHRNRGWKKRNQREKFVFSFSDYKPGEISSPLQTGLSNTLSRLNYEFSPARDAASANSRTKRVPTFDKSDANKMSFVGNISVGQIVPVKAARNILIAATWRTGSTFLGDLLNVYPGSFYYFEPLHYYSSLDDRPAKLMNKTNFLKSLYSCRFDSHNIGYLHHVAKEKNRFLLEHYNTRLWQSCMALLPRDILCLLPEYLSTVCPLYPLRLVKTVRLRVADVEHLVRDRALALQVIVLVRDPRGMYNSRRSGKVAAWCSDDECSNPATGCADLASDLAAAFLLERKYPGTVHLVRYEDLSMEPEVTARRITKFLNLPWTEALSQYIKTHTSGEKTTFQRNSKTKNKERKTNPYGTSRNSSATAFAWLKSLELGSILNIQDECRQPMEILGYRLVKGKQDLKLFDFSLEKTADEVWL